MNVAKKWHKSGIKSADLIDGRMDGDGSAKASSNVSSRVFAAPVSVAPQMVPVRESDGASLAVDVRGAAVADAGEMAGAVVEPGQERTDGAGQVVRAKFGRYAKHDVRYWRDRVKRQVVNGKVSGKFMVRMKFKGRRHLITLKSLDAKKAGAEAQEIWRKLQAGGWDAVEAEIGRAVASDAPVKGRRKQAVAAGAADASSQAAGLAAGLVVGSPAVGGLTCGELLELHSEVAALNVRAVTRDAYHTAFRAVVGDLVEAASPSEKKLGHKKRREAVDAMPLSAITREAVQGWMARSVRDATVARKRTIRARLTNARQVFAPAVIEALRDRHGIEMVNPFDQIKRPSVPKTRHENKVDLGCLLEAARKYLGGGGSKDDASGKTAMWLVLLLTLGAGLRRKEVDNLRWSDIDFEKGRVNVQPHGEYRPKTDASARSIPADAGVMRELTKHRTDGAMWVIPEKAGSRKKAGERATAHYEALAHWLRELEVDGRKPLAGVQKPLHELRKEAGSLVNQRGGLQQARVFLGHTDIQTTANHYLDSNVTVTTGLGGMMRPEKPKGPRPSPAAGPAKARGVVRKRVRRKSG